MKKSLKALKYTLDTFGKFNKGLLLKDLKYIYI